ncbi:DUF6221 family protein [Streptomyces ardesiacus]|uniref:DUF6221 family protein n=1 Tax=Streptomyces ardesiacus TaxID=285564 RepID=UPI002FDBF938
MDDLVQWLRAQLDDDERTARAATEGPWSVDDDSYAEAIYAADRRTTVVAGGRWGGEASVFESTEDALHIARHDPARVLREIDAKRRLIALHRELEDPQEMQDYCATCEVTGKYPEYPCKTLRLLALPYADRPGYRDEWRP